MLLSLGAGTRVAKPHRLQPSSIPHPGARRRDAADGAVDSWIESVLTQATRSEPAAPRDRLLYVVEVAEQFYVPRFTLAAYLVTVAKDGVGSTRRYDLAGLATASAKHVTQIDRIIGRLVNASGLIGGLAGPSPVVTATLLLAAIRTGRLHWGDVNSEPLRYEPLDDARLAWSTDDDGRQRVHVAGHPGTILLPTIPLWYADPDLGTAGPLETRLSPDFGAMLAGAPSLTADQARRVYAALRRVVADDELGLPDVGDDATRLEREPKPMLRVTASHGAAALDLRFDYGERPSFDRDAPDDRNVAFEMQAHARIADIAATPLSDERAWLRFIAHTAPRLRRDGWTVEIDERFPYDVVEAQDVWRGEIVEGADRWFDVDLGVDVDGERIALLPLIMAALAENGIGDDEDLSKLATRAEPIYARLPNGSFVALPAARVARVLAMLAELFGDSATFDATGKLRVARSHAAALADLERGLRIEWRGMDRLRALLDALTDLDAGSLVVPPTFNATLRPYQREGVAWLQALTASGFGGVLADDMGLGKTVQFLAHAAIERANGRLDAPILIVAPTSVAPNWRAEIARFVPSLRVLSLTGADRATRFSSVGDADIVLTTYALLPRDADFYLTRQWSIAVLDEAQAIKNPRVKAAAVARRLHARQRIAMTGTPIENHLDELWSIFAFAQNDVLGDRAAFRRVFRTPIEKRADALRQSALATRLRPFLLRRTKERVAQELPEKTEIVQRIELSGEQRDLYETIRLAMHERVRAEVARRGLARSRIVVLDALLKLRQVCCDPRLLRLPAAAGVVESHKLEALLDMLESLIADGRRVLLFSQFTSMLDLIKPELATRAIPFVELRGETRDRETPVNRFQAREVPLFLISLKAGGTGLNLTAADTVIHYDPWWNPAVERQATDRAHRIGQEQHVFVYKLIAEGTVEERILELQARKGALAQSLFDETSNAPLRLDVHDIETLFA